MQDMMKNEESVESLEELSPGNVLELDGNQTFNDSNDSMLLSWIDNTSLIFDDLFRVVMPWDPLSVIHTKNQQGNRRDTGFLESLTRVDKNFLASTPEISNWSPAEQAILQEDNDGYSGALIYEPSYFDSARTPESPTWSPVEQTTVQSPTWSPAEQTTVQREDNDCYSRALIYEPSYFDSAQTPECPTWSPAQTTVQQEDNNVDIKSIDCEPSYLDSAPTSEISIRSLPETVSLNNENQKSLLASSSRRIESDPPSPPSSHKSPRKDRDQTVRGRDGEALHSQDELYHLPPPPYHFPHGTDHTHRSNTAEIHSTLSTSNISQSPVQKPRSDEDLLNGPKPRDSPDIDLDPVVAATWDQCMELGNFHPLTNLHLKTAIELKRRKRGLPPTFEDDNNINKSNKLSPEEIVKRRIKQSRNRDAARKYREKIREKRDVLANDALRLEEENIRLRVKIASMTQLRNAIMTAAGVTEDFLAQLAAMNPG